MAKEHYKKNMTTKEALESDYKVIAEDFNKVL